MSSSAAAAAVHSAAPPTYQVDKLDVRSLLPDMYAGTKEEYMRIGSNNLQGDKTSTNKFARHSVFAVITAWSAWEDNPKSKGGMKKQAQEAGFLAEYVKTLAAWAHSCQQWVR